jgi:hypothetical protein
MSSRDRRKLREIVRKLAAIRGELRELELSEEAIVRQVSLSAGDALNWIALAVERPENHFATCCRALEDYDPHQALLQSRSPLQILDDVSGENIVVNDAI